MTIYYCSLTTRDDITRGETVIYGAEDEPVYEVIIVLDACNIYQIEQENRNLYIEKENRIFAIDEEQRNYSIPFEDRVYEVTC